MAVKVKAEARCIGCGCTDSRGCVGLFGSCFWVRVDRDAGLGVCSACADLVEAWDRGDRTIRIPVSSVGRKTEKVKFRPANGLEWKAFDTEWCGKCRFTRGCPIPDEAARRKVSDPLYPTFWVIHNGAPSCTAFVRRSPNKSLDTRPPSMCRFCGAFHQEQEPHELTEVYRRTFVAEHGRAPTWMDAMAHTTGIIRAATEAALQEKGAL